MTSLSGISSSSLLSGYLDSTNNADLNTKDIFKKLSIDVGGDGKSITKDQLDSYIKNAEDTKNGTVKISDNELKALKTMQSKWDTISKGSDTITYANMTDSKDILKSMDSPDDTSKKVDLSSLKSASSIDDVDAYLMNAALSTSFDSGSGTSATSMLKSLLTGTTDENDDSNANLIAKLTNIIANSKKTSTIEKEA